MSHSAVFPHSSPPPSPLPPPQPDPMSGSTTNNAVITTTTFPSSFSTPARLRWGRSRLFWHSGLGSALQTAVASAIVGVATIYGPASLRCHLTFPAFSYLTAILIASEKTLGASLHGAACALYGTALGVLPALMTLFLVKPAMLSVATTMLAVALSSFVVALADSAGPIALRIALGQIVIIYVATFSMQGEPGHIKAIWHPANVAASTALGVVAAVLAVVLPYPRLAFHQALSQGDGHGEAEDFGCSLLHGKQALQGCLDLSGQML